MTAEDSNQSPLPTMTITLRLLAIIALAFSLPACASSPKKAACCSNNSGKCAAGDTQCKAPTTKKKAS
jgi:hypothetical protein